MNKIRRSALNKIVNKLEEIKDDIENVMNEEQSCFDNLTEGLQATMRGQAMEEAIDNMDNAISTIDDVIEYIEQASF